MAIRKLWGPVRAVHHPLFVVGITHPQTCLVLRGKLRALREAGFRVVLICSPGPLLERTARQERVDRITIPMRREIAPLHDLISLFRLWWTLLCLRPDVAEFSTPKAGLLGSIAALLCCVPVRVYVLRGLRLETAHGWMAAVLRIAEQIAAACAQHVICNSPSLRDRAVALRIAPARKLEMLGYGSSIGVDIQRFFPGHSRMRKALKLPRTAPVIGYVGRLTCDKGIPELIEAFDDLRMCVIDARLLLVGWFDESEDALSPALRAYIQTHPAIVCTGFVSDTAPYYRVMDLMVLPTWREGFPNVVLEAAASGIPVVSTTATGACDAVVPGVTGLLVPPGSSKELCAAMLRLLGDPGLREKMGALARRWVVQRFVAGRVLGGSVAFYQELLNAAGVRRSAGQVMGATAVPE